MSITVDSAASAAAFTNGNDNSWNHTTGAGANGILVVGFFVTQLTGSPAPTVDGVAMTLVPGGSFTWNVGFDLNLYLFYKLFATLTAGAKAIDVPLTDGIGLYGGSVCLVGVDQTTPFGTVATNNGVTGPAATVDVTSAAGEVPIDMVYYKHATDSPMTANNTQQWQGPNVNASETLGQQTAVGAAPTVTMSWSQLAAVDHWGIISASLKPAGATAVAGTDAEPIVVAEVTAVTAQIAAVESS